MRIISADKPGYERGGGVDHRILGTVAGEIAPKSSIAGELRWFVSGEGGQDMDVPGPEPIKRELKYDVGALFQRPQ